MKGKNLAALSRGRDYMLARFANLPVPGETIDPPEIARPCVKTEAEWERALRTFRQEFGDLHPGIPPSRWANFVLAFRYHWLPIARIARGAHVSTSRARLRVQLSPADGIGTKNINEMDDPSAFASSVLALCSRPMVVDFFSARLETAPDTLLHWLLLWFIQRRRNLAYCALESCAHPYFVKARAKNKYCSEQCATLAEQLVERRYEQRHPRRHARQATAKRSRS
jgi:hypothetical protein